MPLLGIPLTRYLQKAVGFAKVWGKGCETPPPCSARIQRKGGDFCCMAKSLQCSVLWAQRSEYAWLQLSHVLNLPLLPVFRCLIFLENSLLGEYFRSCLNHSP